MRATTLIILVALTVGPGAASGQDGAASGPGGIAVDRPHVLQGFVDFNYLHSGRDEPDGFREGRMVGELTSRIGETWTFLGSASATIESDGLQPNLERLQLLWMADEHLTLAIGRQYAPVGFWNSAFQRGAWRRTTAEPPEVLDPDRALLPLHSLGLTARGHIPGLGPGLRYVAGMANGRDRESRSAAAANAFTGERAWMMGLYTGPVVLDGLQFGGLYYRDRAPAGEPAATTAIDEQILSGFAAWQNHEPRLLAEYARIAHSPLDGAARFVTRAYYLQASYGLSYAKAIRPYVRAERIAAPAGDPLLDGDDRDYSAVVAGLRYDFAAFGAVKAEYRNERFDGPDRTHSVHLQASVRLSSASRPPLLAYRAPEPPAPPPVAAADTAAEQEEPAPEPAEAERDARPAAEPEQPAGRDEPDAASAAAEGIAIVAHPGLDVENLSLPELRRIFRGDRQFWSDDDRVVLLIPTTIAREQPVVLERIYQMGESEFRQFWLSKLFRTAGSFGPKMVSDVDAAQELVASLPGAITFMPAGEVEPGVRLIRIDGSLPGDPEYPLR